MDFELKKAAQAATELLGVVGRASTPPVEDRRLPLRTHEYDSSNEKTYPVALIGSGKPFTDLSVEEMVQVHPNSVDHFLNSPGEYQALLVNSRNMGHPWQGADTGSAAWKSEIIYQACSKFRAAGVPVYVIRPATLTTPFLRWKSLATATFPRFSDLSEDTGNANTRLWDELMRLDDDQ